MHGIMGKCCSFSSVNVNRPSNSEHREFSNFETVARARLQGLLLFWSLRDGDLSILIRLHMDGCNLLELLIGK